MFQGIVGDGGQDQFDDEIEIIVEPGQTVTVTNIDPANTLAYQAQGDTGPTSTLAPSAQQSFSQPGSVFVFPNTAGQRVSFQVTGGNY